MDAIAERIRERDRRAAIYAHQQWLETGRDLLEAKALLDHGKFMIWCREALNYSARTAQKLMRAAETWDTWPKSEPGSVLPRPTIIYALSAPSVPQELRDRFAPRVIAGEEILAEVRSAIRQHRASSKVAEGEQPPQSAEASETQAAHANDEEVQADSKTGDVESGWVVQDRNRRAFERALDLIQMRLGDDLSELLALADEAGGCIFTSSVEGELWWRARGMSAGAGIVDPAGG